MLIIIEGADGTGKTSLCEEVARRTGGRIVKKNQPVWPPLIEYTADLASYKPGTDQTVICDRWHIGERVYGPLYRGGCGLSPIAWAAVEGFLDSLGAVIFVLHAPLQTLTSRLLARGETPDPFALERESAAFSRARDWSKIEVWGADSSKMSTKEMATNVISLAKEAEERTLAVS